MDFEGVVEGVENDFMYQGTYFGFPLTLKNIKRSTDFQFKSTDIVVAGFPKTGGSHTVGSRKQTTGIQITENIQQIGAILAISL